MNGPLNQVLGFCAAVGLIGTAIGIYQCINGLTYSLAAQHESSTVGHVIKLGSRGGFRYEFSVNGVQVDDYSEVCATPLAPGACYHYGPVLVFYSYQPVANSRLEDFAVASSRAYRIGKPSLAVGLPFLVLSAVVIINLHRKATREDSPGGEDA